MADSQVKTANICNITSGTPLYSNAGGSGTYIADNSISVHMASGSPASGIYAIPLSELSVIGDKYTISFIPICATNTALLIELAGVQRMITFTSGERKSVTIQASANNRNIAFYGGDGIEKTIIIEDIQIEKGETATPYRPYSATGWQHSLRKLTTATDTITTLPVDIYADGTNATVGISGNTVQSSTPTPDNPVMPQGCGERTENLFDKTTAISYYQIDPATGNASPSYSTRNITEYIDISTNDGYIYLTPNNMDKGAFYDENKTYVSGITSYGIVRVPNNAKYIRATIVKSYLDVFMIVISSTPPSSYEPYGYKIPILSASTTTPVYLGEVESTRRIKKLVLTGEEPWNKYQNTYYITVSGYYRLHDVGHHLSVCSHFPIKQEVTLPEMCYGLGGLIDEKAHTVWNGNIVFNPSPMISSLADWKSYLAAQYAVGTPVTVWYVLATPETAVVNEPLMKIGDYADTVSGITIPTITGKNTFDVETTLKPSEVSLSYTGWHDATVKEKSRNLLNPSDILYNTEFNTGSNPPAFVYSDTLNCSNYIPVTAGTYLRMLNNVAVGNWFYEFDTNKNYLRTKAPGAGAPMEISADAYYVAFNISKTSDITKYMFARTSTPLPYEPYWK